MVVRAYEARRGGPISKGPCYTVRNGLGTGGASALLPGGSGGVDQPAHVGVLNLVGAVWAGNLRRPDTEVNRRGRRGSGASGVACDGVHQGIQSERKHLINAAATGGSHTFTACAEGDYQEATLVRIERPASAPPHRGAQALDEHPASTDVPGVEIKCGAVPGGADAPPSCTP